MFVGEIQVFHFFFWRKIKSGNLIWVCSISKNLKLIQNSKVKNCILFFCISTKKVESAHNNFSHASLFPFKLRFFFAILRKSYLATELFFFFSFPRNDKWNRPMFHRKSLESMNCHVSSKMSRTVKFNNFHQHKNKFHDKWKRPYQPNEPISMVLFQLAVQEGSEPHPFLLLIPEKCQA